MFAKTAFQIIGFWLLAFALLPASASTNSLSNTQPVLVSSEWVKNHLNQVVLIDLSSQSQYLKYHLPGAYWMSYEWLIQPQDGLALSGGIDYMRRLLSEFGIQRDDHIVIYDDLGNLDASRLYWELKKLQHPNVSIMDGGTVHWVLQSYPLTQSLPPKPKLSQYPLPKRHSTAELTADLEEVLQAKQSNAILLDIRTREEYQGDPKQPRSGHIPDALWFDWRHAVNADNGYLQHDDKALLNQLADIGIQDLHQPIIIYCNSGHRAARTLVMLEVLGFTDVKLYDASMQEYEPKTELPLKQGMQP